MDEDKEQNVYDNEVSEELEQSEEIDEMEEGFMKGYNEDIDPSKCANCKKTLDNEEVIEREFDGNTYYFCSEECANKFESRNQNF